MIIKRVKPFLCITVLSIFFLHGCNQLPVRNPFAGRQEPKLEALPPLSKNTRAVPELAWATKLLAKQQYANKLLPTMHGNTIFVADHTGKVVALNSLNGKKEWQLKTKKQLTAGPTYMDDTLFLASSDAKIIALDAANGKSLWETKVSSEVLAPPAAGEGLVVVHASDGSVFALSANSGEMLWSVMQSTPALTLRFSAAPIIHGDKVLVGFASGRLLALNLSTGDVVWERIISLPRGRSELQRMVDISADPIVVDNTIYVVTYQGKLAAVDILTGNLLWEREISAYQNMALAQDILYLTDIEHALWAVDRHSGLVLWKQKTLAKRYITGPAVIDDYVAVADRGGFVHFLSGDKGNILSRVQLSDKYYQGPVANHTHIFFNGQQGKIVALSNSKSVPS